MPYTRYADRLRQLFGCRVQKLSIDAGFTCPNRDGTLGRQGCTFCVNDAFNPSYCQPYKSITRQIDEGIAFHRRRYRNAVRYLAYFQAYSNTYAPLEVLRQRYGEALSHPAVAGLVIGTRPDCVDDATLDYIASLSARHYVAVEYGVESCYDRTLQLIRRGHTFAVACDAIRRTRRRGIHCGAHLILGLPGESRGDMLREADILSRLPIETLKLHQLQILRGSLLQRQLEQGLVSVTPFTLQDYISLVCDFRQRLRPDIVIERYAGEVPPRFQAQPGHSWRHPDGRLVRNEEVVQLVDAELRRRALP
ncbi:MAG: radical SAM protein [bacterium P3]|nr:MAG: radical SAM protein [bacterium P3]KWW40092.1 MAG: radical SAM protein [bacterium F083]